MTNVAVEVVNERKLAIFFGLFCNGYMFVYSVRLREDSRPGIEISTIYIFYNNDNSYYSASSAR